jgi:hypothetical protein
MHVQILSLRKCCQQQCVCYFVTAQISHDSQLGCITTHSIESALQDTSTIVVPTAISASLGFTSTNKALSSQLCLQAVSTGRILQACAAQQQQQ